MCSILLAGTGLTCRCCRLPRASYVHVYFAHRRRSYCSNTRTSCWLLVVVVYCTWYCTVVCGGRWNLGGILVAFDILFWWHCLQNLKLNNVPSSVRVWSRSRMADQDEPLIIITIKIILFIIIEPTENGTTQNLCASYSNIKQQTGRCRMPSPSNRAARTNT